MIYYRILEAQKIGLDEPVWSIHWSRPRSLDQAIIDVENLRKNDLTKHFKVIKMEDVEV